MPQVEMRPRLGLVNKLWGRDRGGVEAVLHAEAVALDRCGFDVSVLACRALGEVAQPFPSGVRGHLLPAPVIASMPVSAAFVPALSRLSEACDGLHFHLPFPLAEAAALPARKRGPWIATLHADVLGRAGWVRWIQQRVTQRFLARVDVIRVSSAETAQLASLAAFSRRVHVLPFGFDLQPFARLPVRRPARPLPVVVFLGRLVPYKGVDVLLRAAAGVPAQFHIIGEGRERGRLEALARELGLGGRVRFWGHVPDGELPERLFEADLLALPSRTAAEAFGIAQVEAMAAGLPVVNTALGTGTDWVSLHGVTGLTVPANDPAALAGALRHLAADRAFRLACGRRARQRARELFDIERRGPELAALWREWLAPASRSLPPARPPAALRPAEIPRAAAAG